MRLKFSKARFSLSACLLSIVSVVAVTTLSGCISLSASKDKAPIVITSDTKWEKPTGFNKFLAYFKPYRLPIQQGNFVSQEMVAQLKEGMTREQVNSLLGTPLLTDMFHEDRWDYPFRLRKSTGEVIVSHVAIFFKNNTVEKFEGVDLPTEKEYLSHISSAAIKDLIETAPDAPVSKDGNKK